MAIKRKVYLKKGRKKGPANTPASVYTKTTGMPARAADGEDPISRSDYGETRDQFGTKHLPHRSVRSKYTGKNTAVVVEHVTNAERAANRAKNKDVVDKITGKVRGEGHAKADRTLTAPVKTHAYVKYEPVQTGTRVVAHPYTGKKGVQCYGLCEIPVYSTSNPNAVPVSRDHNGNTRIVSDVVATKFVKGKHAATPKGERKSRKALFTWQDKIDRDTAAAVTGKTVVNPRAEVTRYNPEELRATHAKAVATARSMAAFARKDAREAGKIARRKHIAEMLSRKTPVTYAFPVVEKVKKVKKSFTAEMHKEQKRAAVLATTLYRAECISNHQRKLAAMGSNSRKAA